MVEVEIHNFQSIAHSVVHIEGFTALVGRSNIGKSAVVRAVKAALTGAPADAFVRHGPYCLRIVKGTKSCKCSCKVHIRAEGFDLLWEKGDDTNRYVFNGKEYTAVSKGTPDFLKDGFALAKIGDTKELLQIADQFSPIFLLNQSGSAVADVLSDVARLDQINVATRLAEKDRKEAAAQRKVREKDVMDLKIRLSSFDGLDDVAHRVAEVEATEQRILSQRAKIDRLVELHTLTFGTAREVKALNEALKTPVPDSGPLQKRNGSFEQLGKFHSVLTEKQAAIDTLAPIETVKVPALVPFGQKHEAFATLDGWVAKLRTFKDFLTKWRSIDGLPLPLVEPLIEALGRATRLASFATKYENLVKAQAALEASYKEAEAEERAVRAEQAKLGVCPTCTQPLGTHTHAAGGG